MCVEIESDHGDDGRMEPKEETGRGVFKLAAHTREVVLAAALRVSV